MNNGLAATLQFSICNLGSQSRRANCVPFISAPPRPLPSLLHSCSRLAEPAGRSHPGRRPDEELKMESGKLKISLRDVIHFRSAARRQRRGAIEESSPSPAVAAGCRPSAAIPRTSTRYRLFIFHFQSSMAQPKILRPAKCKYIYRIFAPWKALYSY